MNDSFVFSINVPISFSFAASTTGMLLNIMQPLFADALGINWTNVTPVTYQEPVTTGTTDLIICIFGDSTYLKTAIELQVTPGGSGVSPSLYTKYGIDQSKITSSLAGQPFGSGSIVEMYNYYLGSPSLYNGQIYYITH